MIDNLEMTEVLAEKINKRLASLIKNLKSDGFEVVDFMEADIDNDATIILVDGFYIQIGIDGFYSLWRVLGNDSHQSFNEVRSYQSLLILMIANKVGK
jgi:hypothetical protein